jgi:hypothetical protein
MVRVSPNGSVNLMMKYRLIFFPVYIETTRLVLSFRPDRASHVVRLAFDDLHFSHAVLPELARRPMNIISMPMGSPFSM